MDISKMVLTPDLIEKGYSVDEQPQENTVYLKCRGEYLESWTSTDGNIKDKYIRGVAYQHYALKNHLIDACHQTVDSCAGWI